MPKYLLLKGNKMLLFFIIHLPMYDISNIHHCHSKRSSESTGVLLAFLQLHVAHADNLAHKADAGPDEVHAAEVLKGQRKCKRR